MPLNKRTYEYGNCGVKAYKDCNAAVNLENYVLAWIPRDLNLGLTISYRLKHQSQLQSLCNSPLGKFW